MVLRPDSSSLAEDGIQMQSTTIDIDVVFSRDAIFRGLAPCDQADQGVLYSHVKAMLTKIGDGNRPQGGSNPHAVLKKGGAVSTRKGLRRGLQDRPKAETTLEPPVAARAELAYRLSRPMVFRRLRFLRLRLTSTGLEDASVYR